MVTSKSISDFMSEPKADELIFRMFMTQLKAQLPVDIDKEVPIKLRSASDFANVLHIHVNHLNRVNKRAVQMTTTQIITENLGQEAKRLLDNTEFPIFKIAFILGFREANHFSSFFKKHYKLSPSEYRKNKNDK